MDLLGTLQAQLTPDVINQLSQQVGASPEQTQTAAQGVFSTLVGGLANNANSGGANAILSALDKNHDGSVLDDVMGLISGQMGGQGATNGAGIVQYILGGQQSNAAQMVSQASGIAPNGVMDLMVKLAPMVMGALGQQKQQQGFSADGLVGFLSNQVQQNGGTFMQMASQFLDKNNDGNVTDDLMNMGSQLLGGLFNKK